MKNNKFRKIRDNIINIISEVSYLFVLCITKILVFPVFILSMPLIIIQWLCNNISLKETIEKEGTYYLLTEDFLKGDE